jgi:hypothetical protein
VGRPKKYADAAERSRAFRLRKKIAESPSPPTIDVLARAAHRLYKKRAADGDYEATQMLGKTPFETLVRSILYEVLFERRIKEGELYQFPGWENLIRPVEVSGENGYEYLSDDVKVPTGVCLYLPNAAAFFEGDTKKKRGRKSG